MSTQNKKLKPIPSLAALAMLVLAAPLAQAQDNPYGYPKKPAPQATAPVGSTKEGTESVFDGIEMTHFQMPDKASAEQWFKPQADDVALLDGTEKSFTYNQLRMIFTGIRPDIQITTIFQQLGRMKTLEARNFIIEKAKELVWSRTQLNPVEHKCQEVEHLMCFVINRGLELAKLIDSQSDHHQPGALDQEVRLVADALTMAKDYYTPLMDYGQNHASDGQDYTSPNYREFGLKFSEKFMVINESMLSSYAQYGAAYTILGYFAYDLNRKRLLGEDSAYRDANRGAAAVLYQALVASDMPAPDSGNIGDAPTRLRNIEKLWRAYNNAKQILDQYGKEHPQINGRNG